MSVPNELPIAIIADDEELGRLLLAESAEAVGLRALSFDNGSDALSAAQDHAAAIVLLDVEMPGLNGYEVCRRLRADARFANVPIIMVTSYEDSEAIRLAFEAGATDFIAKPVNWALLPRRLEYILRNAAATQSLSERVTEIKTLVEALPDALWVVDGDANLRWTPNGDLEGNARVSASAPPEVQAQARAAIRSTAADGVQRKIEYRDGPQSSYEVRFTRREVGDVVVVRQDTSERTAASAHIERLAYFDPLTGLPNRQRCIEAAEAMFGDARLLEEQVAVLCLDLNSLKRVNDTFGHTMGDAVLRAFAERLEQTVRESGIEMQRLAIARFGGDEFMLVLRDGAARTTAVRLGELCCEQFKKPIRYQALEFYAAPSIGIAVFPDDGADVSTVFKHADIAMYQARSNAAGAVASYTPAMSSRMRDWLELESRLRRAVHDDLLHLVYQPKFRLSDNRIAGVEALLRWRDAEYGDISPNRFVEIAEDSGLILDMSGWVIRAVCRQLRRWLDRGLQIPVAINISGKDLLHGDPAALVAAEAAACNVPASLIEIEITESVMVRDSARVQGALEKLRHLGCRIALDDFGTGYSSLAYISRFPPDRIKIDKAFLNNVDRSPRDAAIASAILSLGANLNLTVTAEGVERREQLEWLRARGCHEIQGFLLSRPLSAADLEARFFRSDSGGSEAFAVTA